MELTEDIQIPESSNENLSVYNLERRMHKYRISKAREYYSLPSISFEILGRDPLVRRIKIPEGWLYQIQTNNTIADISLAEWSVPILVKDVDSSLKDGKFKVVKKQKSKKTRTEKKE